MKDVWLCVLEEEADWKRERNKKKRIKKEIGKNREDTSGIGFDSAIWYHL